MVQRVSEIRDKTNKLLYFTAVGAGGRLDVRMPDNKLLGWCVNGDTRDTNNRLVCKGENPGILYSNYIGQEKSNRKTRSKSSKSKDDNGPMIVVGIIVAILFMLTPGVLFFDVFYKQGLALGEKWLPVSIISSCILFFILLLKRKNVYRGFIYYGIICLIASIILFIMWHNGAHPLAGNRGYIIFD